MPGTRTLTLRCRKTGCTETAQITVSPDDRTRYRVYHWQDGTHTLQEWVEPEYKGSDLRWDKAKWR